ncbi:TetR/AcrR family transcriptional regulator [Nocardia sp. NPDC051756]|uniref:TetR/AcrR family transcriptional regulator n=1 Tax=Nocardia sp. NPDC051756 TaxID=3154751 RepID=UPI00343D6FDA
MDENVNAQPAPIGSAIWWRDRYLRRQRARGRGLDIDTICAAALTILDRDGLADLTMRRVAEELGTGSASLYRHVASRDELLTEVADLILGEVPEPDPELNWRDSVDQIARGLRAAILSHQSVVLAVARGPLLGPNAMRIRELCWRAMDRDGCDPQFTVQTFFTVIHFVVCSCMFSLGARQSDGGPWQGGTSSSGLADLLDALPTRQFPTVLKLSEFGDKPDPAYDFDLGLTALLDGLAALAAKTPPAN